MTDTSEPGSLPDGWSPPDAPEGLSETSVAAWREHHEALALQNREPTTTEALILGEALRHVDLAARIETELATADLMVKGSTGQLVPNGLLLVINTYRATAGKLLASLAEPKDRSAAGRAGAAARWGRRDGQQARRGHGPALDANGNPAGLRVVGS